MTFEKVTASDKPMYGPRKLLLCGFPADAQPKFKTLLKMIGLSDLPVVWAAPEQARLCLADLLGLADGAGEGVSSLLPRAIIVSGIAEKELHALMDACRQTGMKAALWAAITPTSETWTLAQLLTELEAERTAMKDLKNAPSKK
ncbi:MAG: DUF3783 domain-containing protein [Thermodesulfobacteriota bacterium]|nr:DUF3783 domain-containing protein [Thermodesulfobacteriota bacterium]